MNRTEVFWVPTNADNFLLAQNNDLALYKLEPLNIEKRANSAPIQNSLSCPVSDDWLAILLAKNVDNAFMKCFDVYPNSDHENLVAVGHANGRVLLTSPFSSLADSWMGREFLPKHSRACLSLAWNPKSQNLLAVGMDKYRADNSIFIWDLNSRPVFVDSGPSTLPTSGSGTGVGEHLFGIGANSGGPESRKTLQMDGKDGILSSSTTGVLYHSRALYEMASSESVCSLAWFRQNSRVLLGGLSGKYIRLFDLRDSSRHQTSITTKAVFGLSLDPFSDNRLCSHSDTHLLLWDLRYNDKPLLTIAEQRPILKIQWDPVRRNVFSCLRKDSTVIHFYHLQQIIIAEENEISYIENPVQPFPNSSEILSSYALHPTEENRLLCASHQGTLNCISICDRLALDWNCQEKLIAAFPKYFAEISLSKLQLDSQCDLLDEDVALLMKRRASMSYGLVENTNVYLHAADLCKHDTNLQRIWIWMDRMKALATEEAETWSYETKYPGALAIFRSGNNRSGSNSDYRSFLGDVTGHSTMTKIFTSAERDRILQVCGWGGILKEKLVINDGFIQKLLMDKEFERAAAVALFTLRLKLAAQILTNAATSSESLKHLQLVALALAGFPGMSEKESFMNTTSITNFAPSFWLELCNSVLNRVENPYLKAAFLFLASKCNGSNSYDSILELEDLPVNDKIAFAAVHLSDAAFLDLLETLFRQCLNSSNLIGLMICGFGNDENLQLIESFVDETGDVQSAALLLLLSGTARSPSNELQNGGTGSGSGSGSAPTNADAPIPPPQLQWHRRSEEIVACYLNLLNRWRLWHVRAETEALTVKADDKFGCKVAPQVYLTCTFCSKSAWSSSGRTRQRLNKLGSCPYCKKPLPRCSLCRLHMGTPLGPDTSNKLNKFDLWFSWCQTCRHGGHAQHLTDWFQQHSECPVTGCTCKCVSLDTPCG